MVNCLFLWFIVFIYKSYLFDFYIVFWLNIVIIFFLLEKETFWSYKLERVNKRLEPTKTNGRNKKEKIVQWD